MTDVTRNLAIFAVVYIPTLLLVLWLYREDRAERCDSCGAAWKKGRSHNFHICETAHLNDAKWDA